MPVPGCGSVEAGPAAMIRVAVLVLVLLASACSGANPTPTVSAPTSEADVAASPASAVAVDVTYAEASTAEAKTKLLDVYSSDLAGNGPVVVLLHGGGADKNDAGVSSVASQLAQAGLVVFVPSHAASGQPSSLTDDGGRRMREAFEDALCALEFASEHAAEFGGSERLIVVGQSAGGFLGMIATLGGVATIGAWDDIASNRDTPQQVRCVSNTTAPAVDGFVGFNGAYFVFQMSGLSVSDPELWSLADPRSFLSPGGIAITSILGGEDELTPRWHVDEVGVLTEELQALGYRARVVIIEEAGHGWETTGEVWEATLAVILDVAGLGVVGEN